MTPLPEDIMVLVKKYLTGTITPEERRRLNEWYHSFNDTEAELTANNNDTEEQLADRIKKRLFETIHSQNPQVISKPKGKWQIPAAAAAGVLIVLSIGLYFMFSHAGAKQEIVKKAPTEKILKNDIAPGGNKAVLTLANGSTILLDSSSNGILAQQGNIKIQKLAGGLLAYNINGKRITQNDKAFYNTISTPRGGEYQVTLSDGTKVWLDAASSIRFPVVFTGKERKVVITGEAYFEVVKNKDMPFKVEANSTEIVDLGTHFNVNAYNDEASIKATLLEGKVKVSVHDQPPAFLIPGQQADINKEGKIKVLDNVDTDVAVAWMHGHFQFKSADIQSILRQIARWYDVDIVYEGNVDLHFTGQLNKNLNVSKIFETLSLTNEVHFKIEDKKIIVTP